MPLQHGWTKRGGSFARALRALGIAATLLCSMGATADGLHTFWEISGKHNTVWLFGAVHVLHSSDTSLPQVATNAYGNAEKVVEELVIDEVLGELAGPEGQKLQFLPEGQTLPAVLGPDLYSKLQAEAQRLGIDLEFMSRMQPWFVAQQVESLRMLRAGFNPLNGVDMQIAARARQDGKPVLGLETLNDQLGIFAGLSMDEQRDFLRATLEETESEAELRELTKAWRDGDLKTLQSALRKGAEESPVLFRKLTVDRNRRWIPQIEQMLQDQGNDYLIVTGALHMVGRDGLVELLRRKGYKVVQK
ncbi:MAG: TraB/GumN family protein [Steroidobacteraceae bacterium]